MPKNVKKRKAETTPPVTGEVLKNNFEKENARMAATLILADLSDYERAFLATCQKIQRQETGCNTPFEEFFTTLVAIVRSGRLPDPDEIARELETFRQNWEDMKRAAGRFLEAYPDQAA